MSSPLDNWPAFPIGKIYFGKDGKKQFSPGLPRSWEKTTKKSKDVEGSAGIVPGKGRVVADLDKGGRFEEAKACLYKLPATTTAETQSGGLHAFFLCPDATGNAENLADGAGELRKGRAFVIRPGSKMESGEEWKLINSVEPATVSWKKITTAFAPLFKKQAAPAKTKPVEKNEIEKIDRSAEEFGLLCRFIKEGRTKEKCFAKMQVMERWNERPDSYKELTYNKALAAVEKETESTTERKDIPTSEFVDFNEFNKVFENTHGHLKAFDLVNHEVGLIGHEFYALKKFLCYEIESIRQKTKAFKVGKEAFDNRLHAGYMAAAGDGKGQIKNVLRMAPSHAECNASRINLEQLIGKVIKRKGMEVEKKGYFGETKLIGDEAQGLLCEEDKGQAAVMREFRIVMDVYLRNWIEKKLVDTNFLRYPPETRMAFFVHDIMLPATFFDTGTFRRLFFFTVKAQQIEESAAYANLLEESREEELRDYVKSPHEWNEQLTMSKEALEETIEWIQVFNRFTLKHPNQRVRALGMRLFFTGKLYFFRLIAVLANYKKEKVISAETATTACFDCIQFLLETLKVYANNSRLTLSRDIWKTEDNKTAMFFEWLYYNDATNKADTKISIFLAQDQIQDIYGVNERQARAIFNGLKRDGYIDGKQKGKHGSIAWLNFSPGLEKPIKFSSKNIPALKDFLIHKGEGG